MFKSIWWKKKFTKIIKKLKLSKMKLFNTWSWPAELVDDIRSWSIVRSALKEELTNSILSTYKYAIRIDKIGRLYTVINVPDEFYEPDKQKLVQYWLVEQLRELDEILMQCGLSEFVYPIIEKIADKDAFAYLIILSPPTESLSFWKFTFWCFNVVLTGVSLILINSIVQNLTGYNFLDLFSLFK